MAEFNANIVVQPYNIDVTLNQPGITVNPDVTSLNIYAVGGTNGVPAGNVGDLQYYAANGFGAVASNVANYSNGNLNLSVTGTKISGGTNGYVLQTDGAGNISWTAQTGGGGNGSPGGSNTQIQYNDSGLFGGSTGFTFNKTSNLVSMPGALTVNGNITGSNANFSGNITASTVTANLNGSATTAGTVTANAQPNITSVGNLSGLNVIGTMFATVLRTNDTEIALGLGAGQTLQDTGAVALGVNAGYYAQGSNAVAISYDAGYDSQGDNSIAIGANSGRNFQGTNSIAIGLNAGSNGQGGNSIAIGVNAAPNVQHDNTIVINASGSNLLTANTNAFYIKPIRNDSTSDILFYNTTTGEVTYNSSIPTANYAAYAGNVTVAAQPNITSVGTLTSLAVTGNITAGNSNVTGSANSATINASGNANVGGVLTVTGNMSAATANITNLNISNVFGLGSGTERVTISNTAANTSLNFDVIGNSILFQSANAASNITLNVRGNATVPLSNVVGIGNSVTITFINKNGAIAYGVGNISIDGSAVVPMWSGATGNGFPATVNGRDIYTFNIIRTGNTDYTVMGTRVGFV